jgi:hypothetical protein
MSFDSKQSINFIGSTNALANGIYNSIFRPISMNVTGTVSADAVSGNYLFYNGGKRFDSDAQTNSFYYIIFVTNLPGTNGGGWSLVKSPEDPTVSGNVTPTFVLNSRGDYFDIYDVSGVFFDNVATLSESNPNNPTGFKIPDLVVGNDDPDTAGTDGFFVPSYDESQEIQNLKLIKQSADQNNEINKKFSRFFSMTSMSQRNKSLI